MSEKLIKESRKVFLHLAELFYEMRINTLKETRPNEAEMLMADDAFMEGIYKECIKNASATFKEGANKQVISSQADSLIKISRIWADFFPANNRISLFRLFFPPFLALFPVFTEISPTDVSFGPPETGWPG